MRCQSCKVERIASISAKSSDLNFISVGDKEHEGYVPNDMGIGGGDYIEFKLCLNCGVIQGGWPRQLTELEGGDEAEEESSW